MKGNIKMGKYYLNGILNIYEVIEEIGKGATATVYRVRNNGKDYAFKLFSDTTDEGRRMMREEADKLKMLGGDVAPKFIEIIDKGKVFGIVMELIEGITLKERIYETGIKMTETVATSIAEGLCDQIIKMHNLETPIIYRDLKPSNIILDYKISDHTNDDTEEFSYKSIFNVRLIDFGAARFYEADDNNDTYNGDTVNLGTKGYAAPEQFGGIGQTSPQTDIYGIGMILYQMVTGLDPSKQGYEMRDIMDINPELSPELNRIIRKCTSPHAKDRYSSVEELKETLSTYGIDVCERKIKEEIKLGAFAATLITSVVMMFAGIFFYGNSIKALAAGRETYLTASREAGDENSRQEAMGVAAILTESESDYRIKSKIDMLYDKHTDIKKENNENLINDILSKPEWTRQEVMALRFKYIKKYLSGMKEYITGKRNAEYYMQSIKETIPGLNNTLDTTKVVKTADKILGGINKDKKLAILSMALSAIFLIDSRIIWNYCSLDLLIAEKKELAGYKISCLVDNLYEKIFSKKRSKANKNYIKKGEIIADDNYVIEKDIVITYDSVNL